MWYLRLLVFALVVFALAAGYHYIAGIAMSTWRPGTQDVVTQLSLSFLVSVVMPALAFLVLAWLAGLWRSAENFWRKGAVTLVCIAGPYVGFDLYIRFVCAVMRQCF